MYVINFTVTKKKFCLSLHYNEANSYLFVNGTEIIKFEAKDSEIVATPLRLGNISIIPYFILSALKQENVVVIVIILIVIILSIRTQKYVFLMLQKI